MNERWNAQEMKVPNVESGECGEDFRRSNPLARADELALVVFRSWLVVT